MITTYCPKCLSDSGNDWSQCGRKCPMPMSPYFSQVAEEVFMNQDFADSRLATTSLAFDSPEDEASYMRWLEEVAFQRQQEEQGVEEFWLEPPTK